MVSITLKNIPEDLYQRLKSSAERNRRSLSQEAQMLLEAELSGDDHRPNKASRRAPEEIALSDEARRDRFEASLTLSIV